MTRLVNRPAEVTVGPGGVPISFRSGRGAWQKVEQVLDSWSETGRWWEQEEEQHSYRVVTAAGGVFELTWYPIQKRWCLYKAYD